MGFLDLKYEAFGLDINDLSLKIVKLKKQRKGFVLDSFNQTKIMPGVIQDGVIRKEAVLVRAIKSAYDTVKGKKIKSKYVIASLPEENSFLQVIKMPKMTEEELKLAVPLEAENYIPLSINEVYLDFQVISSTKDYLNYLEVLIVAMPKKIVDSYVSCFKKAGLVPIILEAESEAITRALIKNDANPSLVVLIDFGQNSTNLIVYSGHSIRFTSSIPISSDSLTRAISESLKIDLHEAEKIKIEHGLIGNKSTVRLSSNNFRLEKATKAMCLVLEDLTEQIKKYLKFYRDHSSYEHVLPNRKTEKILLCGGGSELKGLTDFMSKHLEIPVELGDPLVNVYSKKVKSLIKESLSPFTTAIGLAIRQVDNNKDYKT